MSAEAAVPSAEDKARYEAIKSKLVQSLQVKRALDKQLASIELQIHQTEGAYLTESHNVGGNVIQGFEGFLKGQGASRRKYEVNDADRIFSNSSLTYQKSIELMGEGEESVATNDDNTKQTTPGVTTVIVPPATRTQELTAAQQKKNRDREYQRRKRAAIRRSAGTLSDDESTASGRRPTKRARVAEEE